MSQCRLISGTGKDQVDCPSISLKDSAMKKKAKRRFSATETMNTTQKAGLFQHLPSGSKIFLNSILPILQKSYFSAESETCFRYCDTHLVNCAILRNGYQAFHVEKLQQGYTEEELEESHGFLLFDQHEEAKEVCEKGLRIGHTSCAILGDPSKGVYASKHSDCLDRRFWYHGRSGFLVILRLIKGRVKPVRGNHTPSHSEPTPGFDCHAWEPTSEESNPSSLPPFECMQYFLYEVSGEGEAAVRPRHVLPFALVAFSYVDAAPCTSTLPENSTTKPTVLHYHPWRGVLQIKSLVYYVGLRSDTETLTPAKLPTALAVDKVMSVSTLMTLLPHSIFETRCCRDVSLEGRFFCLYEVVTSVAEDSSLALLTHELKNKQLVLVLQLDDFGLLVLLSSLYFLPYQEKTETLLAMFVFPDSCTVQDGSRVSRSGASLLPSVLKILPGLTHAETEVGKCPPKQQETLCELLEQHLQSYTTLIPPVKPDSSSGAAICFQEQCDDPEMLYRLYSSPKCGEVTVQRLQAYLGKPEAYCLPVGRAMELLAGRQEEQGDATSADKMGGLTCAQDGPPALKRRITTRQSKSKRKKVSPPANPESPGQDSGVGERPAMMPPPLLPLKRKGFGYGLKTIITDCGRVFVPHGSAMSQKDIETLAERQRPTNQCAEEMASAEPPRMPAETADRQDSNTDTAAEQAPSRDPADRLEAGVPAGLTGSPPVGHSHINKKKTRPDIIIVKDIKGAKPVISIKELRTVFQSIKRKLKCSDVQPLGEFDEPQLKKNKSDSWTENKLQDISKAVSPGAAGPKSQAPATTPVKQVKMKPFKKQPRSRMSVSTKENKLQVCPGGVGPNSEMPDSTTDALTLLADLALGSGGDKSPTNHRPPLKTNPSSRGRRPAKVSHLPLRSPPPKGLVVGGELVSVISQEHSYSRLVGTQGLSGFVESSPLSDPQESLENTDPQGQENTNQPKATSPSPGNMPPRCPVARRRGSKWTRSVVEVGEKISVTRQWKDEYEFGPDSKYTNEPLVKSVMRALHGPWDFGIEETFQQMYLVLHTWIGLFYSKSTTRFFPTGPNGPVQEGGSLTLKARKNSRAKDPSPATSPSRQGVEEGAEIQRSASPAAPQPLEEEVLDLREVSKKMADPSHPCSKVLDLSQKHSEALDLTTVSKCCSEPATDRSHQSILPKPPPFLLPPTTCYTIIYPLFFYTTFAEFIHKEHRPCVDILSDDGNEERDDTSSWHEDDIDETWDSGFLEPDRSLSNEDVYAQICEHIANLHISEDKLLNGMRRVTKPMSDRTSHSNCPLRSLDRDRERDVWTSSTKKGSICLRLKRLSRFCHTAAQGLRLIGDSDHEAEGAAVTGGQDGNEFRQAKERGTNHFSDVKKCTTVRNETDFSQGQASTAIHDGSDFSKEEASSTVHVEKDISEDEECPAVYEGSDLSKEVTCKAVHDGSDFNKEEASAAVHDGSDLSQEETCRAVHDGTDFRKEEASTAVNDGSELSQEEALTAVHDGSGLSQEETCRAVHDGTDLSKDEASAAVHDGSEFSQEEATTAVHDGSDFSQEETCRAVHDGSELRQEEASTAVHDGSDFSQEETCRAVHDGTDFSQEEASTAVHDGSELSLEEASTAVHDGSDFSQEETCRAVHDGTDFSKEEASTAVHDGSDFRKEETSTAVHDGSDFSQEETCRAVHDGTDFSKEEASTAVQDGSDFRKGEASTAVHDGSDFSKEEACFAAHVGSDFSKEETYTAVLDGTDFSQDESSAAVRDGSDFRKEETCTAVHNGTDFSGGESSTAVHDGTDISKEEICTGEAGTEFSKEEASTAVHEGIDFRKGEANTAKRDETFVTKGEERKAVCDLREVHDGKSGGGEEMPAAVFGSWRDSVTDAQKLHSEGDDSSSISFQAESVGEMRSSTPTLDELPCELNLYLSGSQSVTPASDTVSLHSEEPGSGSVTPTQDELPCEDESYRHDTCSLVTEGLLGSGVDPLGSNVESSACLPQCGDVLCSSTHICHQRPQSALGKPFSCGSPDSVHDSNENYKPPPLSEDKSSLSSEVTHCADHKSILTQVIGPHDHEELHTANEESVALLKENRFPQELSSPDSVHGNGKASRHSEPTVASQSPNDRDLSLQFSNSPVSESKPQYGTVLLSKDNSLISHSKPAGSSSNITMAEDDCGSDSQMAFESVHPPGPQSEVGSIVSSLSNPASVDTSSEDPESIEGSQHSMHSSSSDSRDGNMSLLNSSFELIPNCNHHLSKQDCELCHSVTSSQSKLHSDNKLPDKSTRACRSQEDKEGGDIKPAMETRSTRSTGRDSSKSLAPREEEDIEEYNMLGDRESVSSGSFSDAAGEEDAVESPVGEDSSEEQETDEALDEEAGPIHLISGQSERKGWRWAARSVPRWANRTTERERVCRRGSRRKYGRQSGVHKEEEEDDGSAPRPSIITVLDYRGNRRTYENYAITKMVSKERTGSIPDREEKDRHLHSFLQKWEEPYQTQPDLTQSSLDLQYLIFSEKMIQLLKKNRPNASTSCSTRYPWRERSSSDANCSPCGSPLTLQVPQHHVTEEPMTQQRIVRDMHERVGLRDPEFSTSYYSRDSRTPQRLWRLSQASGFSEPSSAISNIAFECGRPYQTMTNNACSGKKPRHRPNVLHSERTLKSHRDGFRKQMKKARGSSLHSGLKAADRRSSKSKFRFYILVTSTDAFFEQTKELLEEEGHVSMDPDQFDLKGKRSASTLLIIIRNEDIADYISTIPLLVELKKAPKVKFVGVDQPSDVLNLTHQELFQEGGFIVCDADALGSFTLDDVKRLLGSLEELRDRGRWKWFLHYRDSRELAERARRSSEAKRLKQLVDRCREAGLVEVMPYHECDVISRDRPDYLSCLLRLQVQHVTKRFPVFITDTNEDSFEKCGILAMNLNRFSHLSQTDAFAVL